MRWGLASTDAVVGKRTPRWSSARSVVKPEWKQHDERVQIKEEVCPARLQGNTGVKRV